MKAVIRKPAQVIAMPKAQAVSSAAKQLPQFQSQPKQVKAKPQTLTYRPFEKQVSSLAKYQKQQAEGEAQKNAFINAALQSKGDNSGGNAQSGQGDAQSGQGESASYQEELYEEPLSDDEALTNVPNRASISEKIRAAMPIVSDWETDIPWQEMQGFAGERTKVFSSVSNGYLCTMGMCHSDVGIVPVSDIRFLGESIEDGPVTSLENVPTEFRSVIIESVKTVAKTGKEKQLELAIKDIVDRSRQGDQNAMAMIVSIRENAKRGSKRAKQSMQLLSEYIHAHPVAEMGVEKSDSLIPEAVGLSHGAPITQDVIFEMADSFEGDNEKKLFMFAVANHGDRKVLNTLAKKTGREGKRIIDGAKTVGQARALQLARLPHTRLSDLDDNIGWEFGE